MVLDYSLKKEMEENYRQSQTLFQQWWQQANIDLKMTIGDSDYYTNTFSPAIRNQKLLQFNKIARIINLISGYQRKNRHVMQAIPIESSDQDTSDQITAIMMWLANYESIYEKISDTFEGGITTGLNLLNLWVDYRDDPENGDIKASKVDYNQFIMDPYWRESDLSDCDWIWQRRYLTKEQVMSLISPKLAKEIDVIKPMSKITDGKFLYMPENRQAYNTNFYSFDHYWKRDYKEVEKLFNEQTGEITEIPKKMDKERLDTFLSMNSHISKIKSKTPTIKLNILVNDNLIYEKQEPYGVSSYPYVPFMCYHYPQNDDYGSRYLGVVRNSRDSQIELNKRRNKMLDILDSQVNSGFVVKEDALVDPEDVFLSGQGRALFLKDTASLADIQQIPPPNIPQSMYEMQGLMDKEIAEIAGVTEELFGQNDGTDTSGFMTQLRMGAGLVSLQPVFDKLRLSQRLVGRLIIQYIQANYGPGKVQRILNEPPTPQFKSQEFQKYDCAVEEGVLTSEQKQLQFIQLLNLKNLGIPVPTNILLEASTLQKKNELIEALSSSEQQQQQIAQAQQQQQMEYQALLTRATEAKAQSDFAMAEERQSRTLSNIGLFSERESTKSQNMAKTTLDNAKAIAELSKLDNERLMQIARFVFELQEKQKQAEAKSDAGGIAISEFIGKDIEDAEKQSEIPQLKKQEEVQQQQEVPEQEEGPLNI